ncbi:hypothetical protein A3H10_00970 [Candidatus Uhrbacteria bacterium RIFCSPLOWO2_12_FULL_46_10]|uniref:Glycerate kinase n=1 Tax=Candidatus Uhrbacteria bacterium RIFCSPLOWO2_01_FULL_47_25 TaxID=1802402 RepID=A0A1F7US83_9BACT|nr:MAG: Hydroxypyruvate reductase [Parcubacteria group bacterium GW2011_GWA2_46_9]OGL59276.1 MAG: hypothetical protein A2752_01235 [Candidatus Uhrbacteria bacterium RIFCSPHIGHO2_01_FULL_46_23]OGL68479.1 MAG: hypothetical protein A3D60_02580 [Candidatus Uhrbacteria bacterium RIFCSPHIGHO2_02_FULL_47_29]OGL75594.1 MAG: hypothetical protein A3E96_00955 [Candidatus Uhrbacteria bacterium RIFCSPHIGHO2_12_FULL_46_13]OGL81109.1 MAG: hypothetical protein A2936_00720 [Candidatus Uhrbacteria bacterium RIFC
MKILNAKKLATTQARRAVLEIAEAGLMAVDTGTVIKAAIKLEDNRLCVNDQICSLVGANRIFLVGVGKCAIEAAAALEEILGAKLFDGIVLGVDGSPAQNLKTVKVMLGTHPLPTEKNIAATKAIVAMLDSLQEKDLVIIIVSGGGSTLLCLPEEGATCVEEGLVLQQLFRAGVSIQDVNTIRKHLSLARGGYLAKYAYPAQVISLIFSDVPGNDLEFIASGPTIKDTTTVVDADAILVKYGILKACGLAHCGLIETPKEDKYFERVQNILFVSNKLALEAMAAKAHELGYVPTICTDCLTGEAREVGIKVSAELHAVPSKSVRLYGGETTVTIKGQGKGGRNQELALGALSAIQAEELIMAFASDGRDNTDASGAICDTIIKEEAARLGLAPNVFLQNNDSYTFFKQTGGHLITGYTGSNVSDLLIALKS